MKKILLLLILFLSSTTAFSQYSSTRARGAKSFASAPSNPVNGDWYYDTTLSKFRCRQAGAWTDCIGSGGGGSYPSVTDDGTTLAFAPSTKTTFSNVLQNSEATYGAGYITNLNKPTWSLPVGGGYLGLWQATSATNESLRGLGVYVTNLSGNTKSGFAGEFSLTSQGAQSQSRYALNASHINSGAVSNGQSYGFTATMSNQGGSFNTDMYGGSVAFTNSSSGTGSLATALRVQFVNSSGTITEGRGLSISHHQNNTGTTSTYSALYIDSNTNIGATTNFAINSQSTANSRFSGNIQLTSGTGFDDPNGLAMLRFTQTGSADSYVNIANGLTGATISTLSADTNSDLTLKAKGSSGSLILGTGNLLIQTDAQIYARQDASNTKFQFGTSGTQYGIITGNGDDQHWFQFNRGAGISFAPSGTSTQGSGLRSTAAGVINVTDGASAGGTLAFPTYAPTQITASVDDWNLIAGKSYIIRVTDDGLDGYTISGITAGVDGETHLLIYMGAGTLGLLNNSGSSQAQNRFQTSTGAQVELTQYQAVDIIYSTALSRWLVYKRTS